MSYTPNGLTSYDLQREVADTLRSLFADTKMHCPSGEDIPPRIFVQELSLPTDDADTNQSEIPYVLVRLSSGEIDNWDSNNGHEKIHMELYLGVYNSRDDRSGHVELLNMIQRIKNHFGIHRHVNNFSVLPSFRWVLDEEDRHPYYFGAITMSFSAPRTIKEDPFV